MQQDNRPTNTPGGKVTRSNTRPNAPMQSRGHQPTYRARPVSVAPPGPPPRDVMGDRANARITTDNRRRRIRMAMFIVVGLLAAGTLAVYAFVVAPIKQTWDTFTNTTVHIFQTPGLRPAPEGGPNATPVMPVFPDWGKEPVNILLIGLDYRPTEEGSRADTQIIVHIDPVAKTAAMVSIPRDLWVQIPGHGESRINSGYLLAERDKTSPGGGPGLAMSTIEYNFGVKIDYFAQVDFTGFESIVDTLGGVTIDVPKPLVDNDYPLGYGTTRIYIPAGLQQMNGRTALQYARSRHADSDIGRNSRQQQVLLSIRQKGLSLDLLSHLNELLTQLSGAVKTDLNFTQVGTLVQLSKEIDKDSIQTVLIDNNLVTEANVGGADVLMPIWSEIRPAIQKAFANPKLSREDARISVQNGTTTAGIGRNLQDQLVKDGYNVVHLDSATDAGSYERTTITDFTDGKKPHTIEALTSLLGLEAVSVKVENPENAPTASSDGKPVDILVIAGDDRLK